MEPLYQKVINYHLLIGTIDWARDQEFLAIFPCDFCYSSGGGILITGSFLKASTSDPLTFAKFIGLHGTCKKERE